MKTYFRENESNMNRKLKQMNVTLKHMKQNLGKLLSKSIIPTSIQSLKFPIVEQLSEKIETNPLEIVKKSAKQYNDKKSKKLKLYKIRR